MTIVRNAILTALIVSLASCGGGGGDSDLTHSSSLSALPASEAATYEVSGTVQALKGTGLVLENNGSDTLHVAADGSFTFTQQLASGSAYSVVVHTQPTDPPQSCTVSNGSGKVGTSAVTNIVVDCTATAATTSVGSAHGQPSTKTIDAAGGSLVSPDGRLTLTIPPNAVANATDFSIQPITNQAPGGRGKAYRLGPAGQTFDSAVQISFQYASTDIAGSLPSLLQVASQNSDGYWVIDPSIELDTTHQTVTASVAHFSDWTLAATAYLEPATAFVPVGGTVQLAAMLCEPISTESYKGAPLAGLCESGVQTVSSWAVDGLDGGNTQDGTVSPGNEEIDATYHAPSAPPQANPVAVSVELTPPAPLKGKVLLVSNLTVYAACNVSDPSCRYLGTATATISYSSVGSTSSATANISASVTWGSGPQDGGLVDLVPVSGTISVTSNAAGCVITPGSAPLPTADDYLSIDFSTQPATYKGSGGFVGDPGVFTETCTLSDGTTATGPWVGGYWFFAPGPPQSSSFEVDPTGAILGTNEYAPLGSWSWNFHPATSASQ